MNEGLSREGSWIATRKGKIIVVCGIIATAVVAAIVVPFGVFSFITRLNAYLDSNKLHSQRGDKVTFAYIGSYVSNGTVFDSGTLSDQVIGSNSLLSYFDQQLIGMEPGVEKTIVIPDEFGYTASTHQLYGHDLRFEVTITKLTRDGTVLYPIP
jgi:hypothetical protein